MHTYQKVGFLILALTAVLVCSLGPGWASGLGPREITLWEHGDFSGRNMVWVLDPSLRHKLVPELPEWFNDRTSSIQVGSDLNVALFQHANYAGPSTVYTVSGRMNSYWNDKVSSLVIFPKAYTQPLGAVLSDSGFNTITGYERRMQFFPIPEPLKYHEANYPVLGDYINDRAQHVKIHGPNVQVTLYEDAHFEGYPRITLPSSSCGMMATYSAGGHTCFRLSGCAGDMDGNVSSLKVRLIAPEVVRLKENRRPWVYFCFSASDLFISCRCRGAFLTFPGVF